MFSVPRLRAVLALHKDNYPDLIERGKAVYDGFVQHPEIFVTPHPAPAVLKDRIDALALAQQVALTRVKGSAAIRNVKAKELCTCLETARAYTQELVDTSPPEQGVVIIEAAGMLVGKPPVHEKPLLKVTQSKSGGPVELVANVGLLTAGLTGKVFFNWQSSTDGGKTWNDLPSTPHGHTQVAALPLLVTCAFRVSVTGGKEESAWSQAVTFLVH